MVYGKRVAKTVDGLGSASQAGTPGRSFNVEALRAAYTVIVQDLSNIVAHLNPKGMDVGRLAWKRSTGGDGTDAQST